MLSRLALRNVPTQLKSVTGWRSSSVAAVIDPNDPKRMVRPMDPPPVRLGFIPYSWFQFFYPKTGVTGPYMFLVSVSTFLMSKEYYIMEHEFYNGLSLLSIIMFVHIKYGKVIGDYLGKQVDDFEAEYETDKQQCLDNYENQIKALQTEIRGTDGQLMLFDVMKQNVYMQLEATYRERLAQVYTEVKKRLDYHAQIGTVERRIAQRHMVQWITNSVLKSITPELEKANLLQCITDLEALSAKA